MSLAFRPVEDRDAAYIADHVSDIDRMEMGAVDHRKMPVDHIIESIEKSAYVRTVVNARGVPVGLLGVAERNPTTVQVWLTATKELHKYPIALVRMVRAWRLPPELAGRRAVAVVHTSNIATIRWLSRAGWHLWAVKDHQGHLFAYLEREEGG